MDKEWQRVRVLIVTGILGVTLAAVTATEHAEPLAAPAKADVLAAE